LGARVREDDDLVVLRAYASFSDGGLVSITMTGAEGVPTRRASFSDFIEFGADMIAPS